MKPETFDINKKEKMQEQEKNICPTCGKQLQQEQMANQEDLMPYLELLEQVPELRQVSELPQEVLEGILMGKSPLHAYREYQNNQLKEQLETMKRAKNAPSSVASNMKERKDAFSQGFDEGFLN